MEPPAEPEPYAGEQLVGDDSYLRKLPIALLLKERMRFDAIVTSADMITQAFNALRQFTGTAGTDVDRFNNGGRAFALSQCWTLVDQLHAIRQLLVPPEGKQAGPFAQAFIDCATPATLLRNHMDHLANNLDNLSKKKGSKLPLFGCLSYFYSPDAQPEGGSIVTIMSGALHGGDLMPFVNPIGKSFTLPSGLFTLQAAGQQLDFGRAIGALRDWLRRTESTIESDIRERLAKQGATSEEIEAAMATLGGGVTLIANFEFVDDDEPELQPSGD